MENNPVVRGVGWVQDPDVITTWIRTSNHSAVIVHAKGIDDLKHSFAVENWMRVVATW